MVQYKSRTTNYLNVFGINFLFGGYNEAKYLLDQGSLMVVPAAPALAGIMNDHEYHKSLTGSCFAIFDSGFMVLLLKVLKRIKMKKLSGLEFLRKFLEEDSLKHKKSLMLIDPTNNEKKINHHYLLSKKILIGETDHYVAPIYNKTSMIQDTELLKIIELKKPQYILLNLGGGTQEKLGLYLKTHLSYRPGIICTGAAIAFLTGQQASIPAIIDKLYLGWLMRCLNNPIKFIPRYISGFLLFPLLLKHGKCKYISIEKKYEQE